MRRGGGADAAGALAGLALAAVGALVALLGADAALHGEPGAGLVASAVGWSLFITGLMLAGGGK